MLVFLGIISLLDILLYALIYICNLPLYIVYKICEYYKIWGIWGKGKR